MELIEVLKEKFESDIKRYSIKSVVKNGHDVIIKSDEHISWDLYESIKLELVNY